ncbi:MAG: hypothetical protein QX199_12965 [Methylococcaceae bacterium]
MSKLESSNTDKPIENSALQEKTEHKPRKAGNLKGQIWLSDVFDEPMSEEELALWYDGPVFPTSSRDKT